MTRVCVQQKDHNPTRTVPQSSVLSAIHHVDIHSQLVGDLEFLAFQDKLIHLGAKTILKARKVRGSFNLVTPSLIDITGMTKSYDEENFGPMLQVFFADTFDEAVAEANNTKYGLAAGLISDNEKLFDGFVRRINAGIINFNSTTTGASGAFPFGGIGRSGNLRPAGFYAADYCAWPKASIIKKL